MEEHLTLEQMADWLATDGVDGAGASALRQHLERCQDCREKLATARICLDLAGATIAEQAESAALHCPSEIELAAYAEGKLAGEEWDQVRQHVEACHVCRTVIGDSTVDSGGPRTLGIARGRSALARSKRWKLRLAGSGMLAAAAAIALFFLLPKPLLKLNVTAYGPDVVRSATAPADHVLGEFDVAVSVGEPVYVHLLTVDRSGMLDFLIVRQIDSDTVLGRYGLWPSGQPGNPLKRRTHVLVLAAQHDLSDRLDTFDYDPIVLTDDPKEAAEQIDSLCRRIKAHFGCVGRFEPIPDAGPARTP